MEEVDYILTPAEKFERALNKKDKIIEQQQTQLRTLRERVKRSTEHLETTLKYAKFPNHAYNQTVGNIEWCIKDNKKALAESDQS